MPPIEVSASERWWTVSPLNRGIAPLCFHNLSENGTMERRADAMLTIESLIAVLSFGVGCFSVGYAFGRKDNHKSQ